MATTHLTDLEAQPLGVPDLLRRAQSGEEIWIKSEFGVFKLRELTPPEIDSSAEATLARLLELERITGEPLRMDPDFAEDMEEILALRRSRQ